MDESGERPKLDLSRGRGVLDALRRVLSALEQGRTFSDDPAESEPPDLLKPPQDSFADGVDAERELRKHLGVEADSKELGEFLPPEHPAHPPARLPEDVVLSVSGTTHVLKFPYFQAAFFAWLDPAKVRNLRTLAALEPEHVEAIKAVGRKEIERRIIRRTWRRAQRWTMAAVVASFVAAHWFADQIAWIGERLPVLREAWAWAAGLWR